MARKRLNEGSADAIGLAAWAVTSNLMKLLHKKKLLDQQEYVDVIDHALSDLESLSLDYDDAMLSGARAGLELLMKRPP